MTRLTLKELETRNDSRDEELKRTSQRRVRMLSRFKLRIYYDTRQVFISTRQCAQTKTTKKGK